MSEQGGKTDRKPYRLTVVLEALRRQGLKVDSYLEKLMAAMVEALEDDGVIDTKEAQRIVLLTAQAYASNGDGRAVLALLDESTMELALREVERQEARGKA